MVSLNGFLVCCSKAVKYNTLLTDTLLSVLLWLSSCLSVDYGNFFSHGSNQSRRLSYWQLRRDITAYIRSRNSNTRRNFSISPTQLSS